MKIVLMSVILSFCLSCELLNEGKVPVLIKEDNPIISNITPKLIWQKSFGGSNFDYANDVVQSSDGGIIAVGSTSSNDGDISEVTDDTGLWVVKIFNEKITWQKKIKTIINGYNASKIINTGNDEFIILLTGNSLTFIDPPASILKINGTGAIIWQKKISSSISPKTHNLILRDITLNYDKTFCLIGSHYDLTSKKEEEFWIGRFNSNGEPLWEKTYGGTRKDEAVSVISTSDNGVIAVGSTLSNNGDVKNNYGSFDYWAIKVDKSGALVWSKNYGGSDIDIPSKILYAGNGDYYIVGGVVSKDYDVTTHFGFEDYWVIKIGGVSGGLIWQKTLGGSGYEEITSAATIDPAKDGSHEIVVVGTTNSNDGQVTDRRSIAQDLWATKLDILGKIVWKKTLGGQYNEIFPSIIYTQDKGFIILSTTDPYNDGDITESKGLTDFWIVKIK